MNKLLKWSRVSEDSPLFLEVFESNKWVHYKNSIYKQPDYSMPGLEMSKGFSTAQKYLSLGYKYVTNMNYIELLTKLLNNELNIEEFQKLFFNKFKNDNTSITHNEFVILDNFFANLNAYHPSDSELFDPDFDLLLGFAEQTLKELKELK